eukprot:ANDGO_05769.mRNA.1 hypothetical protein
MISPDLAKENMRLMEENSFLKKELETKELQLDVMRSQIKRRNQQLEEQRTKFHEELLQLKGAAFDKETNPALANIMEDIDISFFTSQAPSLHESTDSAREIEERLMQQHLAKLKKLKEEFGRERKRLLKERQIICEMKDSEIKRLQDILEEYREREGALRARTSKLHI